jgi:hypothetical protein
MHPKNRSKSSAFLCRCSRNSAQESCGHACSWVSALFVRLFTRRQALASPDTALLMLAGDGESSQQPEEIHERERRIEGALICTRAAGELAFGGPHLRWGRFSK